MSGEEIARELINVLSVAYCLDSSRMLACMRDQASTNNVAICTLTIVYPKLLDVGCFSHTLDQVNTLTYPSVHRLRCFLIVPKRGLLGRGRRYEGNTADGAIS